MKKILHLLLLQVAASILLLSPTKADPLDVNSFTSSPIKVACVGDSITYGATIKTKVTDSYPAQLGKMLGEKWQVRNFGHSGATALNKSDNPYQKSPEFVAALHFEPDVIIIMLGTNDSIPVNWAHQDQFVPDYMDLIGKFQALSNKPHIYLAYPIAIGHSMWGNSDANVVKQQPLIDKMATDTGATVIDLHTPTTGKLDLYSPDQVHPTAAGATLLAKTVYKALTGQDYVDPDPAMPNP